MTRKLFVYGGEDPKADRHLLPGQVLQNHGFMGHDTVSEDIEVVRIDSLTRINGDRGVSYSLFVQRTDRDYKKARAAFDLWEKHTRPTKCPQREQLASGEKKLRVWNDPAKVSWTPIATSLLLEGANFQQLWRMWTTHTAAGQSLSVWISVNLALLLWCNFYRVVAPELNRKAFLMTALGVLINALVVASVIYFRMTGRG